MEKQRWEESGRRSQEVRRAEKRKSGKQEDAGARGGRKVAIHCGFFQWFGAPQGRKVTSLKQRVRSQLARWEMKNYEKVHAVVVRSTFPSQNVQNTRGSDHFWKLRCRKSARRCGAMHILKSKCTKHKGIGPLFDVQMSKKCTLLWREARIQVNMYKTQGDRTTFWRSDVEKVDTD